MIPTEVKITPERIDLRIVAEAVPDIDMSVLLEKIILQAVVNIFKRNFWRQKVFEKMKLTLMMKWESNFLIYALIKNHARIAYKIHSNYFSGKGRAQ